METPTGWFLNLISGRVPYIKNVGYPVHHYSLISYAAGAYVLGGNSYEFGDKFSLEHYDAAMDQWTNLGKFLNQIKKVSSFAILYGIEFDKITNVEIRNLQIYPNPSMNLFAHRVLVLHVLVNSYLFMVLLHLHKSLVYNNQEWKKRFPKGTTPY